MGYHRYLIDIKAEGCEKAEEVLKALVQQRDIEVHSREEYLYDRRKIVRFCFSCIGGEEDYQKVTDELKDILL